MNNIIERKEKVIAYIDGFNLYFGIVDAGFDYCKWLNLKLLVENLMMNMILQCLFQVIQI